MEMTLDAIREDVEARLTDAAANRRSAMHTPVVATADADVRIMVLREFDADQWTLRFHTDARSPKTAALRDDAPLGTLFYDPVDKVQLRCRGRALLDTGSRETDLAWQASTTFARRCYMGRPPGEASSAPTSGLPPDVEGIAPTEEQLIDARANFARLIVRLDTVDWYRLSHKGHRRALLTREDARWLTP